MRVPYNEKTKHIYETVAKIAKEIAAREEMESHAAHEVEDAA